MNPKALSDAIIAQLDEILWGTEINQEVRLRWHQGFQFSPCEPAALVQYEGGPCAVLAPVQGFILAEALFGENPAASSLDTLCSVTEAQARELLVKGLAHILCQASTDDRVTLVVTPNDTAAGSHGKMDITTSSTVAGASEAQEAEKVDQGSSAKKEDCEATGCKQTQMETNTPKDKPEACSTSVESPDCDKTGVAEKTKTSLCLSDKSPEAPPSDADMKSPASEQLPEMSGSDVTRAGCSQGGCGSSTSSQTDRAKDAETSEKPSAGCSSDGKEASKEQEATSGAAPEQTKLAAAEGEVEEGGGCSAKDQGGGVGKRDSADHTKGDGRVESDAKKPKRSDSVIDCVQSQLRYVECTCREEVEQQLTQHFDVFKQRHGIYLFLCSVLLTKGVEKLKEEQEDSATEPLIDTVHGHGSQSLVNLLLTGQAVNNVFDGERDLGGLTLRGVSARPRVGFLSQLEQLRYLEVGSMLKNPQLPLWVLASETHLTVLCSQECALVASEGPLEKARRTFNSRDPEGSGFIPADALVGLLEELGLCADPDYVKFMQSQLDTEGLGIVLLPAFLDKFFPSDEASNSLPDPVHFVFCNGLERSNSDKKVRFVALRASIPVFEDQTFASDITPLQMCIATRWPTVQLRWDPGLHPSLN